MGHDDQRLAAGGQVARPASRCPRRRGGWSARRAPAGRARRPAPGPARPGGARRRTAARRRGRASASEAGPVAEQPGRARRGRAASRGPLVRRPVTDDAASRTVASPGRGRRAAPSTADPQAAGVGDPAGVRRLGAGRAAAAASTCRRRCARRRRCGRPRRRRGSRRRAGWRVPYALPTPSRLTQVARHAQPSPTTRAPATGPVRAPDRPAGAGRAQRDGDVDRVLRAAGQEDDASARCRRRAPPSAPACAPGLERLQQRRPQRAGRRLQVVVQRGPERVGVAGAQRRHQRVGHPRLGHRGRRPAAGRTRRRPSGVDSPPSASADAPSGTVPPGQHGGQHARRGRCPARCRPPARTARRCRAAAASSSSSARLRPVCQSASQATSAAAASALPPAIPPATGMPLVMCSRTSGSTPAALGQQPARRRPRGCCCPAGRRRAGCRRRSSRRRTAPREAAAASSSCSEIAW